MPGGEITQSVLAPAGVQASSIHQLWLLMLWVAVAVFLAVMTVLAVAVVRGVRNRSLEDSRLSTDRALSKVVGAAVATTVAILFVLLIASIWTGRTIASLGASSAVSIAVTGHQWWWEITYEDAVPSQRVVTANEVHIPTGRPVVVKVTSRDVIHSFWIPNLQGKRDLIPGYTTAVWLQADRPGRFRGQCAEFCGLQHAHMALDVVAEPNDDFEAWLGSMRKTPAIPVAQEERRGLDVFLQAKCAGCHTVKGTDAAGQLGPDLTHIASRPTIGAGTAANTADAMAAWIRDPQSMKPGNQMPPNPLSPDDLAALVRYLDTLR